jgi:hypothetical protein
LETSRNAADIKEPRFTNRRPLKRYVASAGGENSETGFSSNIRIGPSGKLRGPALSAEELRVELSRLFLGYLRSNIPVQRRGCP